MYNYSTFSFHNIYFIFIPWHVILWLIASYHTAWYCWRTKSCTVVQMLLSDKQPYNPHNHQFNVSRCFRWGDAGFCPFNLFFTRGVSFPQYLMGSARVSTRSVRSRFNIKYNNRMMGYNWNELDQTSYDLNRWCRIRLTKYAARPALYAPNTAPTTRDGLGWPRRTAPPPEYDKCHQYSY